LSMDGHQILSSLSGEEYSDTLAVVGEAILATDLARHFTHLHKLKALADKGPEALDFDDSEVVSITIAALMTGSDLGATTKPWEVQKEVAGLIAEEFWNQGDLERVELSAEPAPLMNREMSHQLPKLQVGFCEGVCLPVYKALSSLSDSLKPLEEAVIYNRDRWLELSEGPQYDETLYDEGEETRIL